MKHPSEWKRDKNIQIALQRQLVSLISQRFQGRDMCFVVVDLQKKQGETMGG